MERGEEEDVVDDDIIASQWIYNNYYQQITGDEINGALVTVFCEHQLDNNGTGNPAIELCSRRNATVD